MGFLVGEGDQEAGFLVVEAFSGGDEAEVVLGGSLVVLVGSCGLGEDVEGLLVDVAGMEDGGQF